MKRITITFSILFLVFNSFCQTGMYNPFKMVIISPDTAFIDISLRNYIDTIYQNHLKSYYYSLQQMEDILSFKDYPDDMKKDFEETQRQTKANLDSAKKYESDVKKFRYYQTISEYSTSVLQFYFNEYPPYSKFQLIKSNQVTLTSLKHIADSLSADYVVGYKNIHTVIDSGMIKLKITTTLYSKNDNKILFENETSGDTNSYGFMWTCENPLSCLLITGVKTSTDSIFEILYKKQKK